MRLHSRLTLTLFTILTLALASLPAPAADFRFETENDFLTGNNEDDLYTFAVALEIDRGGYLWSLREKAFTDRDAGVRFDETQLAVGRRLDDRGTWTVYGEVGILRLGEGLLGEDVQNALHGAIGDEEVHLDYVAEDDVHATAYLRLDRLQEVRSDLTVGPRLEAYIAPGFRFHAVAGLQLHWTRFEAVAVEAVVGARFSDTSLRYLEEHIESVEPVAELSFLVQERVMVSWSYNDHGTGREHFSLGYRFGLGGEGARRGGDD